jgi:hypothetical protein
MTSPLSLARTALGWRPCPALPRPTRRTTGWRPLQMLDVFTSVGGPSSRPTCWRCKSGLHFHATRGPGPDLFWVREASRLSGPSRFHEYWMAAADWVYAFCGRKRDANAKKVCVYPWLRKGGVLSDHTAKWTTWTWDAAVSSNPTAITVTGFIWVKKPRQNVLFELKSNFLSICSTCECWTLWYRHGRNFYFV